MSDLLILGAVQARHNWDRWIADCTVCRSAMKIPVGTEVVRCWDCLSEIGPITWPADPAGIETILSYRPDPNTRSWEPHETLEDLLRENFEHGCIPPEWEVLAESDPQLVIADIQDQRVTGGLVFDALPAADPRRQLAAARRLAHENDLPFVEPDGVITYPARPELEG